MQVGDFVKGLPSSDSYIINEDMTKGVVTEVNDDNIKVKIINHERGCTGVFSVRAKNIEIIGHIKKFNKTEVLDLLASGCKKAILDYDLRGAALTNANLRDADLRGADLRGADLRGADLTGADLTGADLTSADLTCANLTSANLRGADLTSANLMGAALRDADLRGANLTGADLTSANLRDAYLRDADLRGADLRGADLTGADLTSANLRDAALRDAALRDADLRGAALTGADLTSANLTSANLRGADLRGTDIDFSCYPLWCGSLGLKADKRLACQLAYHLCSMQCEDTEYIKMRNSILEFANQFHRVNECGTLKPTPYPSRSEERACKDA